jgi:hypothetical protein
MPAKFSTEIGGVVVCIPGFIFVRSRVQIMTRRQVILIFFVGSHSPTNAGILSQNILRPLLYASFGINH